jgi:hypothetical protein
MGKKRWKWIGTLLCSVIVLTLSAPQLYGADSGTPVGELSLLVTPPPADGPALVRVYYGADRDLYSGVLISFNVLETNYEGQYHVVQATPQELERLQAKELRLEAEAVRTLDQYFQPRAAPLAETEAIPSYPCYRTVEETFATRKVSSTAIPAWPPGPMSAIPWKRRMLRAAMT